VRLKLDENLSRHLKAQLGPLGHDVETVAEEGLSGRSDVLVGSAAQREQRMLFTLDVEFADIRKHPPGTNPGIILFRPRSMGPLEASRMVLEFTQRADFDFFVGCVVVVEWDRVRVRRPVPDQGS